MEILIDGQPYQPTGQASGNLNELAAELWHSDRASARLVVALCCDGQPVPPADLDRALLRPLSEFQRVELQTQSLSELVQATLSQAITALEDLAATRTQAADLLAQGRTESAMEHLQKFCETLRQVQQSVSVCAQALELDLDSIRVNGRPFIEAVESVMGHLLGLKQAMLDRDFVLVGDILNYELDQPLADWRALLSQLEGQTEQRG